MRSFDFNMHFPDWEGIRAHFRKHKVKYAFGAGVVISGMIVVITRNSLSQAQINQNNGASFFIGKNLQNNYLVSVLDREGRGHPGYMVECIENRVRYISQLDAAQTFDVNPNTMSAHIRGTGPENIHGFHFQRLQSFA